jgi:DNA-binding GntR family transcriptional regulator
MRNRKEDIDMEDYISKVVKLADLTQNKPLNEIVFEGLRDAIIKGIIPVGERINETVYSERMNISRTPIREALRRIQEEGLVEYIPHYGVVVKKITVTDAEEIFQIRKALDVLATTSAMKLMSEEQFEEMRQLLTRTDEANERGDVAKVVALFSEFNDMIYRFSQMPRLDIIVNKLRQYLVRFRDISLAGAVRRRKAIDEHWMIYNNMKNGNFEQVAIITNEHLDYSKGFIISEMIKVEKELEMKEKEKLNAK